MLVDSERIGIAVDVEVLGRMGWKITEDEVIDKFLGRSDSVMTTALSEHLGRPLEPDWEQQFQHLYRRAFQERLQPVQGVKAMLAELKIRSCVASSGSHEKMAFTLGITGLYPYFEGRIFSASEVLRGKPAPDLFLHAAERMGVGSAECAVIEDSPYGLQAALAAGMRAFAYAGGLVPRERLALRDVTIFDSMRDLIRLVQN